MPQKLSKLEEKAIALLLKHQDKGLLQSELWHKLGVTSREGSRIAIRLEKKGMVKRVREFAKDRWTRRLVPLIRRVTVEPIKGAPCLACEQEHVCGEGGVISPKNCPKLERWVLESRVAEGGEAQAQAAQEQSAEAQS
ncbi:MAG: hypothetical protein QW330_03215 [Nitrososphaerota archaeon]